MLVQCSLRYDSRKRFAAKVVETSGLKTSRRCVYLKERINFTLFRAFYSKNNSIEITYKFLAQNSLIFSLFHNKNLLYLCYFASILDDTIVNLHIQSVRKQKTTEICCFDNVQPRYSENGLQKQAIWGG